MTSLPSLDSIRLRTSVRKYQKCPLDQAAHQFLDRELPNVAVGPFGTKVRLALLAASEEDQQAIAGLITYGFIRHAPAFIVGAVGEGERSMEDYGYVLELIVLKAAEARLGTCWLGGTFNRSAFAQRVALAPHERIPAVLSVGHPANKRGLVERAIRAGAKAHTRKPWSTLFFDQDLHTPMSAERAGDYATVLEAVRMGPSASNKQPWRILRMDHAWHLFLQRSPRYGQVNRGLGLADLQRVDMGIAMCHFEVAARRTGLAGRWGMQPPPIELPDPYEYVVSWLAH